jgi:hypothetical protein
MECEKAHQAHYEMTPFLIFNSKEIEINKHINKPMKQPNNIVVISKWGICQLNNFGMLKVL